MVESLHAGRRLKSWGLRVEGLGCWAEGLGFMVSGRTIQKMSVQSALFDRLYLTSGAIVKHGYQGGSTTVGANEVALGIESQHAGAI